MLVTYYLLQILQVFLESRKLFLEEGVVGSLCQREQIQASGLKMLKETMSEMGQRIIDQNV